MRRIAERLLRRGDATPLEGGSPATVVRYRTFDGRTEPLVPWPGERVCLLLRRDRSRDPAVLARILEAIDAGHRYYADTVGRLPTPDRRWEGRDVVAEVLSTCGAGCSLLGASGMEIMRPYFDVLYRELGESGVADQLPFYELGRNFWFWSDQLAFRAPEVDPVVTGFAVWMRFRAISATGLRGGPFNDRPYDVFRRDVEGLVRHYEADTTATFAGTLARNHSPWGYSGTDLWASMMMQLARRHGEQRFVVRFWRMASEASPVRDTVEAVTNWARIASSAAGVDLSPVFYDRWGCPRPDGRCGPRRRAEDVPEPGDRS